MRNYPVQQKGGEVTSLATPHRSISERLARSSIRLFVYALLLAAAVALLLLGNLTLDAKICVYAVCVLYISDLVFVLGNMRARLMYLFLHAGIFLFWLTRPVIGIFYGTNAWQSITVEHTVIVLNAIFGAMLCLTVGSKAYSLVSDYYKKRKREHTQALKEQSMLEPVQHGARYQWKRFFSETDISMRQIIGMVSFVFVCFCFACAVIDGVHFTIFMQGISYEEYFLISASVYSIPYITGFATTLNMASCIYLATGPKKGPAVLVLLMNVVSTLPKLMIGNRSTFIIAIMFMAFYLAIRELGEKDGSWIGKREIWLAVIGVPLLILAMGAINYLRGSAEATPETVLLSLLDSLYKQGVTFKTVEYGFEHNATIQQFGFKFYTIGSCLNDLRNGLVGQHFLGLSQLPDYNSVELATEGSLYAHALAYTCHWNYLGGEGYGTAFILEPYADFGFAGMLIACVVLGFIFAWLCSRINTGWVISAVALFAARRAFYMPRGEYIEWAGCLWSMRFWEIFIGIACVAFVIFCIAKLYRVKVRKQ